MLYKINSNKIDKRILKEAVEGLKNGKIIIYPTDTAYGLGCDAANEQAADKIFSIKGRGMAKSLPVIVADLKMAEEFFILNKKEKELANKFWPKGSDLLRGQTTNSLGKLSIVLKVRSEFMFPRTVMASDNTIAVRAPDSLWARSLSSELERPIVSTSANLSGTEACYSLNDIKKSGMAYKDVDMILDAGKLPRVAPSTVARVRNGKVDVLREGGIMKFT